MLETTQSVIKEFLQWIVPRLWLVHPDESGVRIVLGKYAKLTPPGWYFYWPIFIVFEKRTVTQQVKDIRVQSVWTKDLHDMAISLAIRYKVTNAYKAILEVLDYDDSIQALALGTVQTFVKTRTKAELHDQLDDLQDEILKALREESQGMGLKIMSVYITDVGATRNFRLLGNDVE
jgi:regulator of protease activity HflC (stomatin/prohibitin superfamily)